MNKKEKGNEGEDIACEYLEKRNYCIFRRNFYFHGGEIDVIAKDKSSDEIVFFEVKTRTSLKYGRGTEAINYVKLNRMKKGAKCYLYKERWSNVAIRFDAIEVYRFKEEIYVNHIKQII